jgi:hypothetical protein
MKRKLEIGLLIALIALGIAALFLTKGSNHRWEYTPPPTGKEITIRNVTKEVVPYQIRPLNSQERPVSKVLNRGAIHRYPSKVDMEIIFQKAGKTVVYSLTSGTPYSFRLDENDRLQIYQGSHGRADAEDLAPFVGTPMPVVEKMLELAKVDSQDVVYDLGCGDGRIVIAASKKYGARGVGIDIDPQRIKESKANAESAGVEELVKFYLGDATKVDISEATVVMLYLLPESNELLRPKLEKELKPGTYVVSHNYAIPGWEKKEVEVASVNDEEGDKHTIYLYRR